MIALIRGPRMHLLIAAAGAFDKKRAWVRLDPQKTYISISAISFI